VCEGKAGHFTKGPAQVNIADFAPGSAIVFAGGGCKLHVDVGEKSVYS
jgi:hypothetical protein